MSIDTKLELDDDGFESLDFNITFNFLCEKFDKINVSLHDNNRNCILYSFIDRYLYGRGFRAHSCTVLSYTVYFSLDKSHIQITLSQ